MATREHPKALVLGLDAADPLLLLAWARAGRLPVLAGCLRRALVAEMEDLPGLWTGAVWPSLITGMSPTRHGYYHYHDYDPSSYKTVPFHERGYSVEPFWQTVSNAGKGVAVLDVPLAPLCESLDGVQLVDWGVHEPEGPVRSFPPELASNLVDHFGSDPVGQCDSEGRGPSDFGLFKEGLVERARNRSRLTRHLMDEQEWNLLVSVFSEPHCAGHQCWHLHDPEHPLHDPVVAKAVGDPVFAVYREVDRALGELIEGAGPETHVFVVASHGMGPSFQTHFLLDRVLQKIEGSRAPGSRLFNTLYRSWRRMPATWRSALRPLGARARGSLGAGARRDRVSFELNTHCGYGAVRINLEGREPTGKVAAADFDRTCREITEKCLELVDPDSGRSVVRRVFLTSDHYERTSSDVLPDLIVEWERDVEARAVYSPAVGEVAAATRSEFPNRTGDHRPSGSLFMHLGPGVKARRFEGTATAVDIAPTVLRVLGIEAAHLDGRPIR